MTPRRDYDYWNKIDIKCPKCNEIQWINLPKEKMTELYFTWKRTKSLNELVRVNAQMRLDELFEEFGNTLDFDCDATGCWRLSDNKDTSVSPECE